MVWKLPHIYTESRSSRFNFGGEGTYNSSPIVRHLSTTWNYKQCIDLKMEKAKQSTSLWGSKIIKLLKIFLLNLHHRRHSLWNNMIILTVEVYEVVINITGTEKACNVLSFWDSTEFIINSLVFRLYTKSFLY